MIKFLLKKLKKDCKISYNENIERYAYIEQIINQISLNDISLLAKKYFDENYFNSIQLIKE